MFVQVPLKNARRSRVWYAVSARIVLGRYRCTACRRARVPVVVVVVAAALPPPPPPPPPSLPPVRAARFTACALLVVGSALAVWPQLALRWCFPPPHFSVVSVRLIGLVAQGFGIYYWFAAVSPGAFLWSTVFFRLYLAGVLCAWTVQRIATSSSPAESLSLSLCLGSIALVNGIGAMLMLRGLRKSTEYCPGASASKRECIPKHNSHP